MIYSSEAGAALEEIRKELLKSSQARFRFQPALPERLAALSREKLWISDPAAFNDPLDLRLELEDLSYRGPFDDDAKLREAMGVLFNDNLKVAQHWFYSERLLNSVRSWLDGRIDTLTLEGAVKERFQEFGVACFSPIWNNGLMWSHYANSHAGFCIEYSVKELDLVLKNQGLISHYHVQYSSSLPKLCLSEALFSPHQTLGRMIATKSSEWAYEQEWRLVHLEQRATCVDMPAGMDISALIAGLKADRALIEALQAKAASLAVPAYRVTRPYGYELKMELL